MKDYTPYRHTFLVHQWTHVPVRDEWLHPNHVFGIHKPMLKEVREWLDNHKGGCYAILEDEDTFTDVAIAFSNERDAAFFLLRWS